MAVKYLTTIAAGQAKVIDASEGFNLTVITGAGTTSVISRVDDITASAPTGHASDVAVAAASKSTVLVDWPFYIVTAVGGTVRVALV